jgi:hypothetical protein
MQIICALMLASSLFSEFSCPQLEPQMAGRYAPPTIQGEAKK